MNKKSKKPSFSLKCLGQLFKEGGKSSRKRLFLLPPLTWDSVLQKYIEKKERKYHDRKRKN